MSRRYILSFESTPLIFLCATWTSQGALLITTLKVQISVYHTVEKLQPNVYNTSQMWGSFPSGVLLLVLSYQPAGDETHVPVVRFIPVWCHSRRRQAKMGMCISSSSHCLWSWAPVKEGPLITECVMDRQAMTFNRGSGLELLACSHTDWSLRLVTRDKGGFSPPEADTMDTLKYSSYPVCFFFY